MFLPLLWTCLSRKIGGCKSSQKLPSCWHWDCQSWAVPQHRPKQSLGCSNLPQDLMSLLSGVQRHLLTADVWEQMSFCTAAGKDPQPGAKPRVKHSLKSCSNSFGLVREKTSFCTSCNLPPKRHGHCKQQGQTSALRDGGSLMEPMSHLLP